MPGLGVRRSRHRAARASPPSARRWRPCLRCQSRRQCAAAPRACRLALPATRSTACVGASEADGRILRRGTLSRELTHSAVIRDIKPHPFCLHLRVCRLRWAPVSATAPAGPTCSPTCNGASGEARGQGRRHVISCTQRPFLHTRLCLFQREPACLSSAPLGRCAPISRPQARLADLTILHLSQWLAELDLFQCANAPFCFCRLHNFCTHACTQVLPVPLHCAVFQKVPRPLCGRAAPARALVCSDVDLPAQGPFIAIAWLAHSKQTRVHTDMKLVPLLQKQARTRAARWRDRFTDVRRARHLRLQRALWERQQRRKAARTMPAFAAALLRQLLAELAAGRVGQAACAPGSPEKARQPALLAATPAIIVVGRPALTSR